MVFQGADPIPVAWKILQYIWRLRKSKREPSAHPKELWWPSCKKS